MSVVEADGDIGRSFDRAISGGKIEVRLNAFQFHPLEIFTQQTDGFAGRPILDGDRQPGERRQKQLQF